MTADHSSQNITENPEASQESHSDHDSSAELKFNTTPNLLTMIRIALVPLVVWLLYQKTSHADLAAALVFAAASITDYFDGYLARTNNQITIYGKLLDPLADKFLVVCCLIMLQELGRIHPVVVMLLVCRELAITGLRALASAEGLIIAASAGGKWKTTLQMVAIGFLMVRDGLFGIPLYPAGQVMLYASLAMSLWSAKDYIVDFFKAIAHKHRERRKARLAAKAAKKGKH